MIYAYGAAGAWLVLLIWWLINTVRRADDNSRSRAEIELINSINKKRREEDAAVIERLKRIRSGKFNHIRLPVEKSNSK